jgi:hypothetical protein
VGFLLNERNWILLPVGGGLAAEESVGRVWQRRSAKQWLAPGVAVGVGFTIEGEKDGFCRWITWG